MAEHGTWRTAVTATAIVRVPIARYVRGMLALVLATGAVAAPWHPLGNLELYTSFPTDIGVRGTFEGPGRLRLTGSAGWLPPAYLGAIEDTATSNGWISDNDAELIDTALDNALVLRVHLGWRPFPMLGFQFEAGYSWIGLGGGITGAQIVEAETGYDLSAFLGDDYNFAADAQLHRVEVSFGWEHVIGKHFLIRWDIGGSYTFGAEASVEHQFDVIWPFTGPVNKAEHDAEEKLVTILKTDVHTPIFALGVGWRFQ